MLNSRKRAHRQYASSFWKRWLVVAGLLLFLLATVGQAAHVHQDGLLLPSVHGGGRTLDVQAPAEDSTCLLCLLLHSTFVPQLPRLFALLLPLGLALRRGEYDAAPDSAWHFGRFSRPPPFFA